MRHTHPSACALLIFVPVLAVLTAMGGCQALRGDGSSGTASSGGASGPDASGGTSGGGETLVTADATLNQGYQLLYTLLSKQQQLSKSLWIGSVSEPSSKLINHISTVSEDGVKKLDSFKGIKTQGNPLPTAEQETRAAIESDKRSNLMWHTNHFERDLLLTQVDGLNYGEKLAKTMAKREKDATRKHWLEGFAAIYGKMQKQVVARLTVIKGERGADE